MHLFRLLFGSHSKNAKENEEEEEVATESDGRKKTKKKTFIWFHIFIYMYNFADKKKQASSVCLPHFYGLIRADLYIHQQNEIPKTHKAVYK